MLVKCTSCLHPSIPRTQHSPRALLNHIYFSCLCLGARAELSERLAHFKAGLLPQLHNFEPLEVVQLPPCLELSTLLCPGARGELLVDLVSLPLLLDNANAGSTGELRNDNRGEGEVGERSSVSGNGSIRGRAVNEDTLVELTLLLHVFACESRFNLPNRIAPCQT